MNIPENLQYTTHDEWIRVEGDLLVIGITDFAVEHLSDLTFLDLPAVGSAVTAGEAFGEIESVKSVNDLLSPVSGEVIETNDALVDDLEQLGADAFAAWMIKVKVTGEADNLLDAAGYESHATE